LSVAGAGRGIGHDATGGQGRFRARSRGVEGPKTELGVTLARFRSSTPKAVPPRDALGDHQKPALLEAKSSFGFELCPS
jgi:hypothetical protein